MILPNKQSLPESRSPKFNVFVLRAPACFIPQCVLVYCMQVGEARPFCLPASRQTTMSHCEYYTYFFEFLQSDFVSNLGIRRDTPLGLPFFSKSVSSVGSHQRGFALFHLLDKMVKRRNQAALFALAQDELDLAFVECPAFVLPNNFHWKDNNSNPMHGALFSL